MTTQTEATSGNIDIIPVNRRDLSFIVANLRKMDKLELFSQRDYSDGFTFVEEVLSLYPGQTYVARIQMQPVAVFGVVKMQAGVASGWALGTDRINRVIPAITKFGFDVLEPRLIAAGIRRMEVRSYIHHKEAHAWITNVLGGTKDCVLHDYGKNGESFILFSWTKKNWSRKKKELKHVLIRRRRASRTANANAKDADSGQS